VDFFRPINHALVRFTCDLIELHQKEVRAIIEAVARRAADDVKALTVAPIST